MAPHRVPGGDDVVEIGPEDRSSTIYLKGVRVPRNDLSQSLEIGGPQMRVRWVFMVREAHGR